MRRPPQALIIRVILQTRWPWAVGGICELQFHDGSNPEVLNAVQDVLNFFFLKCQRASQMGDKTVSRLSLSVKELRINESRIKDEGLARDPHVQPIDL